MKVFPIMILFVLLSTGCAQSNTRATNRSDAREASSTTSTTASSGSASGWDAIEQRLRSAGMSLKAAGTIEQPFWTKSARVFSTPGGDLQVYEFAGTSDAEAAAQQVGGGGGTIGTSSMAWMAPPHFFRSGNVIVLYLGSSPDTMQKLESVFGKQFAGR